MEQKIQLPTNIISPVKKKWILAIAFLVIGIIAISGYYVFLKNSDTSVEIQTQQSPTSSETIAYIPLTASLDEATIKTSACLQVKEKIYDTNVASWNDFKNSATASPEVDLVKTITAIQNKDNKFFENTAHSVLGSDPEQLKQQEVAYFQQFDALEIQNVWGYQKFGDLVVFYVQIITQNGTSGLTPFLYAPEKTGGYSFLPYQTDAVTFQIAQEWFYSDFGLS